MARFQNILVTLTLLTAGAAISGCQAKDRAGGSAAEQTIELRFASAGEPGPAISGWADDVNHLSKGSLKVTFIRDTHSGQPDFEAATIADVRAGTVDLAWVGARAFDQVGLTAFQPLLAPMLIDSLELEGKVFDADIPQQLLPSVDQLDLVGVGVLPGPMRKVLGLKKPFTAPADFAGQVVGIQASKVAEQTFRALGATTKPVPASAELTGLDAYDQQLGSIQGNHYAGNADYVTGNLNLWPRPLVIIANKDAYRRLTDDERAIMATASKDAVAVAMQAERTDDARAVTALCTAGLSFAQSSDTDLAAIRKALTPAYTAIREDSDNATRLNQITEVKNALHRAPDSAACTNDPTVQPVAGPYDGTYEMSVVWPDVKTADARCVGGSESGTGGAIYDLVLDKGHLTVWIRVGGPTAPRENGLDIPYRIFKDQMQFLDSDGTTTWDFTYANGKLVFANPRNTKSGVDCGGRAIFTTKPWIRQ